ncbi:hypothetical protein LSAT2_023892 [Lamellibrachia satsuma]|nr:hypothetical protein LSAT2_023892 [Lamellibrachia satsuma]
MSRNQQEQTSARTSQYWLHIRICNCRTTEHERLLYDELLTGKHSQGGQKKRFKETLDASIKIFNIDLESWESVTQDRPR